MGNLEIACLGSGKEGTVIFPVPACACCIYSLPPSLPFRHRWEGEELSAWALPCCLVLPGRKEEEYLLRSMSPALRCRYTSRSPLLLQYLLCVCNFCLICCCRKEHFCFPSWGGGGRGISACTPPTV